MYAILIDVTRCKGCEKCVAACVDSHRLDELQAARDRVTTSDGLSANRLSSVLQVGDGRFARKSCLHCLDPSCAAACLVGGLTKSPDGPVLYDPDKCIGCRYCMLACPFHVPRYEWNETIPYVCKCDMCAERLARRDEPACVGACPYEALQFGERGELLAEARRRIRAEPGRYIDHVWGEEELGGTSLLYVSDVDLAALGWPEGESDPIPALTGPLISKTPHIGLGVAGTLLGLNWIVRRRNEIAALRAAGKSTDSPTEGGASR
jgi:formate dehydrogenase iron-sulfur subunit